MLLHHCPALFGTFTACFSTILAMIHPVISAFFCTGITYVCANFTDFLVKLTTAGHHLSSKNACIGTFMIQLDAPRKNPDILLLKTGVSTMDAFCCTFVTGIYASLKLFVTHYH
jgi:hypothetical protein